MTVRAKLINDILNRVDNIPEHQLKDILDYVKEVEQKAASKDSILSFAGKWSKLDEDLLDSLTTDLHTNRSKDIRKLD